MGSRTSRRIIKGIVLTFVVAALVCAAAYLYLAKSGAFTLTDNLDSVAVVFASRAEDGAEVAQVVAVVRDGGRTVRMLDPRQDALIPGTSYDTLGDAYPFGGGQAVADVLAGETSVVNAYVDVPEAEWIALLQRGGVLGVEVPRALEVFDGTRLVSFAEGTQTVAAADLPSLLRGVAYLETADRMRVVKAVGEASLKALADSGVLADGRAAVGVRTDLTDEAYRSLLAGLQAR